MQFLADRTNGRAYATVLRLSVSLSIVCLYSVTYGGWTVRPSAKVTIDSLTAYRKSHIGNQLVPNEITLTFV